MILSYLSLYTLILADQSPTTVTFVRHGETIANATGKYNSKTLNVLSEKGKSQVQKLAGRLSKLGYFDAIYVSPSERALRSILPYLKATHQKATIWPLLYECCTGKRTARSKSSKLIYGAKITIPKDIAAYFVIPPTENHYPSAPDFSTGLVQVEATVKDFRKRMLGHNLLLVGHSGHGKEFIHALTKKWHILANTQIVQFKVQ